MKWHPDRERQGSGPCALCHLYLYGECKDCPLYLVGQGCHLDGSLFRRWRAVREDDHADKEKEAADEMFELLSDLYAKAYGAAQEG
jgi:hypothetical protein